MNISLFKRLFSLVTTLLLLLGGVHNARGNEQEAPDTTLLREETIAEPDTSSELTADGESLTSEEETTTEEKMTSEEETTTPEATSPESSQPQTTKPQTTKPQTTKPQTTKPQTTKPQTTKPQTTKPQTTKPQTTAPQTTVPQTTVPETTKPQTTAPSTTAPPVSEAPAVSQEDLYWLSRIISAESKGEPMEGMIAVGNVVLNRVRHTDFANTVKGVIFEEGQFTPVKNGTIYDEPTAASVEAAKRCLNGETVTSSALFFFNPAVSTSSWIKDNRTYLMTIGNHAFYG